jgi:hypothetical protein
MKQRLAQQQHHGLAACNATPKLSSRNDKGTMEIRGAIKNDVLWILFGGCAQWHPKTKHGKLWSSNHQAYAH